MNRDTIIFDLDGTLLDTLADLSGAVNYALQAHCLPRREEKEIRQFLGNGIRNLMLQSVPAGLDKVAFEPVFETFRAYYMAHCLEQTCPYPGIMQLLAVLRQRGVRMAIVSNKLQPAVTDLNRRFFAEYITIAIGESPTVRRKPRPDAVWQAIRELGSETDRTIYVGDSEVDVETARRAGVPCASVAWGFRDVEQLEPLSPDYLVYQPMDILQCLFKDNQEGGMV